MISKYRWQEALDALRPCFDHRHEKGLPASEQKAQRELISLMIKFADTADAEGALSDCTECGQSPINLDGTCPQCIAQAEALEEMRQLGIEIERQDTDEWRVNPFGWTEETAYYAPDLEDAIETGRIMAREMKIRARKENALHA